MREKGLLPFQRDFGRCHNPIFTVALNEADIAAKCKYHNVPPCNLLFIYSLMQKYLVFLEFIDCFIRNTKLLFDLIGLM